MKEVANNESFQNWVNFRSNTSFNFAEGSDPPILGLIREELVINANSFLLKVLHTFQNECIAVVLIKRLVRFSIGTFMENDCKTELYYFYDRQRA